MDGWMDGWIDDQLAIQQVRECLDRTKSNRFLSFFFFLAGLLRSFTMLIVVMNPQEGERENRISLTSLAMGFYSEAPPVQTMLWEMPVQVLSLSGEKDVCRAQVVWPANKEQSMHGIWAERPSCKSWRWLSGMVSLYPALAGTCSIKGRRQQRGHTATSRGAADYSSPILRVPREDLFASSKVNKSSNPVAIHPRQVRGRFLKHC